MKPVSIGNTDVSQRVSMFMGEHFTDEETAAFFNEAECKVRIRAAKDLAVHLAEQIFIAKTSRRTYVRDLTYSKAMAFAKAIEAVLVVSRLPATDGSLLMAAELAQREGKDVMGIAEAVVAAFYVTEEG